MIEIRRSTSETDIRLSLDLGATPITLVNSHVRFLDHMLETLARYGGFGLQIEASGDLKHHLIEDIAIAFGEAVREAARAPVGRYGDRVVPMDDALVHVSLDLGGRAYYRGPLPSSFYEHWMQSFAHNARATLHVRALRGEDRHHVVEAAFKALGMSLAQALTPARTTFSTKGDVRLEGSPVATPGSDTTRTGTPSAPGGTPAVGREHR